MFRFQILILASLLLSFGLSSPSGIKFIDSTKKANLNVITYTGGADKDHIVESTGNGVLILDYDGDGNEDLYFVNAYRFPRKGQIEPHANVLFRNNGDGTFTDVSRKAHVDAAVYGQGGCIGDIDNDGRPDIYVTNFGPDILYHNNGDGTFTDITAKAHVSDPEWSIGCTFFDADHDGDQDLYVANYLRASWKEIYSARRTRRWQGKVDVLDGPKGLPPAPNTFYLNNGDGTFTEATAQAGLGNEQYYSMGVVSFDYDNDGDIDLYVANDSTPNCLYRNRGNGTFEEVGAITGAAYNADGQEQGSMGVDFGDYDNDGWFDLIVTNFAHDYYTLYHNLNGQFFQDESFSAGIAIPTFVPLGFGTFFFDVDHDGRLDLFFANGQIYPQVDLDPSLHETYKQRNQLFLNEGNKFREITAEAGEGFQTPRSGRGAAWGDLDNDGDLDIVVSNEDDHPVLLENESKTGNHWLSLQLVDIHGSPLALGATVRLTSGKLTQLRQISSGGSYASQNDLRVNFGLGSATSADKMVVRWPEGTIETFSAIAADKQYILKRGSKPEARSLIPRKSSP